MIKSIISKLLVKSLLYVLVHGRFRIYDTMTPLGIRIGTHDIKGVVDTFIQIEIGLPPKACFVGYFQKT